MMPYLFVALTHARSLCVHPNFQATTRATSDNFVACRSRCRSLCVHTHNEYVRACARVASNYPFAKLMEIAESVPTGRVRATSDKSDKRQNIKFL